MEAEQSVVNNPVKMSKIRHQLEEELAAKAEKKRAKKDAKKAKKEARKDAKKVFVCLWTVDARDRCLVEWLVCGMAGWLIGWLVGDMLVGCLVVWLFG